MDDEKKNEQPEVEEKKKEIVKCPKCHAYFVESGKICDNCKKKAAKSE